ncbi:MULTISPECIES: Phenylacetic acid catabolic protein [unclassified Paenibacillus]|uniref:Phenylacetic acid catabolic protein n=1 Tax=unclassified Paenibacillus TaxID=185978 RepID=UPI0011432D03|nr:MULTISPECIES: Phenylacetic acid catabolic protein [unclassified Paenibacillus]
MTKGRDSFIHIVETIADNKFVLGDRLVEIGVGGPNLEASLSSIAMAQGELGHARLLYNWAFDLKGLTGKKQDVRDQTGKAFRFAGNTTDWIGLIASAYTINVSFNLVLQAMFEAGHPDIVMRIHKLLREQGDHVAYCRGWAVQLANDTGAVPRKFREALQERVAEARAWLVKLEADQELYASGYMKAGTALTARFDQMIEADVAHRTAAHG